MGLVSEKNIKFKAIRSGKPGGQNANRRSTKIQLWVKIEDLPLSKMEKKRIREKLAHHINHKDELVVENEEERSQEMNRDKALERTNELLEEAIKVPPPRIPTRPPLSAEENRIRAKKMKSQKKKNRRIEI